MKERPILFSAPMIRAILDGRKTQTRRIVKPQPPHWRYLAPCWGTSPDGVPHGRPYVWTEAGPDYPDGPEDERRCPYGVPGDRLWVREAWQLHERFTDVCRVVYAASAGGSWTEMHADFPVALAGNLVARPFQEGWRPSIHMPRWASRITLEITGVRVERLNDISDHDAEAEGIREPSLGEYVDFGWIMSPRATTPAKTAFANLWMTINGIDSWGANPWVWAVSFRRVAREASHAS